MVSYSGFHSGADTQAPVGPHNVVDHEAQSEGMSRVFDLAAETICQPGQPAVLGSQFQVQALGVGRGNVLSLGLAADRDPGPNLPEAPLPAQLLGDVFGLSPTKAPDFVTLNPFAL